MFEFKSNIELEDVKALLQNSHCKRTISRLAGSVVSGAMSGLAALLVFYWVEYKFDIDNQYLMILIIAAFIAAVSLTSSALNRAAAYRDLSDALESLGPETVRVNGEGITSTCKVVTLVPWEAVERLIETPRNLLFYYIPTAAVIVRKADVGGANEIATLLTFVREHVPKSALPADSA